MRALIGKICISCHRRFWGKGGKIRTFFEDGESKDLHVCKKCCRFLEENRIGMYNPLDKN